MTPCTHVPGLWLQVSLDSSVSRGAHHGGVGDEALTGTGCIARQGTLSPGSGWLCSSPSANASGVLFLQERLDEFSKQKNEKGEYSVNTNLKI